MIRHHFVRIDYCTFLYSLVVLGKIVDDKLKLVLIF